MISIIALFVYFQHSKSSPTLYFKGKWYSKYHSKRTDIFESELLFYRIENYSDGFTLSPFNMGNVSISHALSQDDFLFVSGKLDMQNLDPEHYVLGIYNKNSSDIFMHLLSDSVLPPNKVNEMMEFTKPSIIKSCKELELFYSKLKNISLDFNYTDFIDKVDKDMLINYKDKQERLTGYLSDDEYFKKQLFTNLLYEFVRERLNSTNFLSGESIIVPFAYLQVQKDQFMNSNNDIKYHLKGIVVNSKQYLHESLNIDMTDFTELEADQSDAPSMANEVLTMVFTFVVPLLIILLIYKQCYSSKSQNNRDPPKSAPKSIFFKIQEYRKNE